MRKREKRALGGVMRPVERVTKVVEDEEEEEGEEEKKKGMVTVGERKKVLKGKWKNKTIKKKEEPVQKYTIPDRKDRLGRGRTRRASDVMQDDDELDRWKLSSEIWINEHDEVRKRDPA